MRDYAKMKAVRILEAADLGDVAVFWFCFGIVVGLTVGQLI